jgi:fatty-acyl-CoA synthase
MRVPLTVNDFLYRAEAVSAYAAAVVDEPVQPAAPARTTTYAELLTRVRGWALPATGVAEGDEGAGLGWRSRDPSVAGGNTEGG